MSEEMLKIQNEEYRKLLLEKDDEINNYKFAIRIKDNQTHELIDKLQQKENQLKEVREKIEGVRIYGLRSGKTLIATLLNDILQILDKENI